MKSGSETHMEINTRENEMILQLLHDRKFRVTPQRQCILDALLHGDCKNIKDIYFEATKRDPSIGIATVYRMARVLEEIGVLKWSTIDINHECVNCQRPDTMLFIGEDNYPELLDMPKWIERLKKELKKQGLLDNEKISIVVRKTCNGVKKCKENETDD